jgi:4-amino-4-deoxy-L-arabinose transferase
VKSPGQGGAASPGATGVDLRRAICAPAELADLRGWLVMLCVAVLGFAYLGTRGLSEPDEGRYSAIAVNMLESGDYLVPRLAPDHPHFAKPPLTYWAIAASLQTFGRSEWAVRLPGALAYTLTALVVALLGQAFGLRRPMVAAAIWATTLLPFIAASFMTPDMLLTLFESVAVLGYLHWRERKPPAALWLMWLSFGAAFMTKGPPALLPLLAILAFEATRGRDAHARGLFRIAPVLTFGALALWWFAYVVARDASMWRYFLVDETVNRFATATHDRNPGWQGLFVVYAPVLLVGTLPFGPMLIWAAARRRRLATERSPAQVHAIPPVFLYVWMAVPFAVFALAQSRLPLYLLPLTVPFALLTAAQAENAGIRTATIRNFALACAALLLALRFASSFWASEGDSRALARDLRAAVNLQDYAEILFVDRYRPAYGLVYYTGRQVAAVRSAAPGEAYPRRLCARLESSAAPLILVPLDRVDEFTRATASCRFAPLVARGALRRWALLAKPAPPARIAGNGAARP